MATSKLYRQDDRWSADDTTRLITMFQIGQPCEWIAETLGRAQDVVAFKLFGLKLIDAAQYIKLTKNIVPTVRQQDVKVTIHYEPVEIGNNKEYAGLNETIINWSAHSCLDSQSSASGFFTGCANGRTPAEVNQAVWLSSVNNHRWVHWLHVWLVGSAPLNVQNLVWCALRRYCEIVNVQAEWFAVIHAENHLHILVISSYAWCHELYFGEGEIMLLQELIEEFIAKSILASAGTGKAPPWLWA